MIEEAMKELSIPDLDRSEDEIASENIANMMDNATDVEFVWIPDPDEVWRLVPFVRQDLEKGEVTVLSYVKVDGGGEMEEKEVTFPIPDTHYLDDSHLDDLDDLCLMNNLHEAPLLSMLKRRFAASSIYTSAGNILISVNPYRNIPGLYDDPLSFFIPSRSFDLETVNAKEIPHLFRTANETLVSFLDTSHNQSVIISGESGAGKTESSKYVMQFLLAANEKRGGSQVGAEIKHVLSASNYVFEAFGNSKTTRNDNSSRFGKFIKLQYDIDKNLVSAFTETFLLEKSRLSHVGQGERNYHVFYQMIRGLPQDVKTELGISDVDMFCILTDGECTILDTADEDVVEFNNLTEAMDALHFSKVEAREMWSLLAAVLHLGSVVVTEKEHDASDNDDKGCNLSSGTGLSLSKLAGLLGCEEEAFISHISYQIVTMNMGRRNSIIKKHLSADNVRQNMLALNKWLYNGLFSWLVKKINYVHATVGGKVPDDEADALLNYIGIMDIFGFEIFEVNSFEQLCINFTNERLQQQFNEHVFVNEQKEYEIEGLDWNAISYKDNQEVIDLIAKKPHGLLNLLEEFGMLNRKADDSALLFKYLQTHQAPPGKRKAGAPPPLFSKPRFGELNFIVRHFAGSVEYCVSGFITKNNDSLQEDIMNLIKCSNNTFLMNVMGLNEDASQPGFIASTATEGDLTANGHGTKAKGKMAASTTVSLKFRRQLDHLMATLRSTLPNYIRCVKPNQDKSSELFDPHLVNEQLKYSGVMEVVRIRREGFPQRFFFEEFCKPYSILMKDKRYKKKFIRRTTMDIKKIYTGNNDRFSGECTAVPSRVRRQTAISVNGEPIERKDITPIPPSPKDSADEMKWKGAAEDITSIFLPDSEYHIGTNKVFLRGSGLILMNLAVRRFFDTNATKIQSVVRMKKSYRKFEKCRLAFMFMQKRIRGFIARRRYEHTKNAGMLIKLLFVTRHARNQFLKKRQAARVIQHQITGFLHRCRFLRIKNKKGNSVLAIQCFYRRRKAQRDYQVSKSACVKIQAQVRGKVSRVEFNKKKRAAVTIQSCARRRQAVKNYNVSMRSLVLIQSLSRQMVERHKFNKKRLAATSIQAATRRHIAVRNYNVTLRSCVLIQSLIRMMMKKARFFQSKYAAEIIQARVRNHLANKRLGDEIKKCIKIQAFCRKIIQRSAYLLQKQSVILMQQQARGFQARQQYRRDFYQVVRTQALVRRFISKLRLKRAMRAQVILAKNIRRFVSYAHYQRVLYSVVTIQSSMRCSLAKKQYSRDRTNIIKAQSVVRRHQCSKKKDISVGSAIVLSKNIRRFVAYANFQRAKYSAITIQSSMRCSLAKKQYSRDRTNIIKAQSVVRRHQCSKMKYDAVSSAVRLQSMYRSRIQRIEFSNFRAAAIIVASRVKGFLMRTRYRHQKRGCRRIQVAVRSFLRNRLLHRTRDMLFDISAHGTQGEIEDMLSLPSVAEYAQHFRSNGKGKAPLYGPPDSSHVRQLMCIRHPKRNFCGILHYAAAHGNNSVVQMMKPGPHDILRKDANGNSVAHYVARHPNLEIFEYLAEAMELKYSYNDLWRCGILGNKDSRESKEYMEFENAEEGADDDEDADDGGLDEIKLLTAKKSRVIKEGYLKKRRAGSRWQKKWVVLTETTLAYYGSKGDSDPKVLIFLESTVVERVQGELVFSVTNDVLAKGKQSSTVRDRSIEFQSASNENLNEWLFPLGALAGVKPEDTNNVTWSTDSKTTVATESYEDKKKDIDEVIFSGYLKKRRVGGRWERRWTVLKDSGITYFKDKGDTVARGSIPIQGSVVTIQEGEEPIFLVTNESLIQKKKHEGKSPSMEFMAENDQEMQQWLLPLRSISGMINSDSHFRPTLTSASGYGVDPVVYVNCELLQAWLSEKNCEGDTPLHILSRFRNTDDDGSPIMPTSKILLISMWLVQNGCPLNGQNNEGQTPLHLAVRYGNVELGQCLVAKGADVTIENKSGQTVLDMCTPDLSKRITKLSGNAWNKHSHESFPPTRLKGYSYLSFHFQKHSQTSSKNRTDFETLKNPYMSISVYNSYHKRIENVHNLPYPVVRRESFVWWGCSWHMHTPLENIGDGCYVIVELKNIASAAQLNSVASKRSSTAVGQMKEIISGTKASAEKDEGAPGETISWFRFELDRSVLNSKMINFECQKPPIQRPAKRGVAAPNTSVSDNSFLEAHLLLSKRGKKRVQLSDYNMQPAWVHHHATPPGTGGLRPTNHMHVGGGNDASIDLGKLFGITPTRDGF